MDEDLFQTCSTDCGKGQSQCVLGSWLSCDAKEPTEEECNGIDDNCDGLVDTHEDCYPAIPDIVWEDDVVEPEDEAEFDLTILQDDEKEDRGPEPIEDPVEPAETVWVDDPWSKDEPPQDEILVEVAPASGCHNADGTGMFWTFFSLMMLMYVTGYVVGLACHEKNEENKK